MRDQINRYARGTFDYDVPVISLSTSSINDVVNRCTVYEGAIRIAEPSGRELKGIVYSTNGKVNVTNSNFIGNDNVILYTVNASGTDDGDTIEGSFNIVSNGGEESIPFTFSVQAGSFETSIGSINNLFHFANLAQSNMEEAVTIFTSPKFREVFLEHNMDLLSLYDGISRGRDVRNNIEQFLIAVHKKSKVTIGIQERSYTFENIAENQKGHICLEKDNSGYVNIAVSSDADFLIPEYDIIKSDMFAGNKYEFEYVVDRSELHAGRNQGIITFSTPEQSIEVTVTASSDYTPYRDEAAFRKKSQLLKLMQYYVRFRTHSMNITEWIRESKTVIDAVRNEDDSDPFYQLALAQIYIAEKKNTEAKWLIDNVRDEVMAGRDENPAMYCYYLYVNTLYSKDRLNIREAATTVNEIYNREGDWRILWILLYLDENFDANKSLKLARLKEQFNQGCISPVLYIEACNIFNEQPLLLRVLNDFEINVIVFGCKNGIASKELINRTAELIVNARSSSDKYIRLLMKLYNASLDRVILECLCSSLIRADKTGSRYLPWYEKCIESELKVTRLFEYYILSRDMKDMSQLPKMALLYFGYNNSLDYVRKAYIFSNIIHNRNDNSQVYRTYMPQMESFIADQLEKGHINDDLSYIYKQLLRPEMVDEDNAEQVSEILFTYKIECSNPNICKIVIRHKETCNEQEYVIQDRCAYVRIYTDSPRIFLVDRNGNRYLDSIPYNMIKMLDNDTILKQCHELRPELKHINIHFCEKNIKYQKKNLETVNEFKLTAALPELTDEFRNILTEEIVNYYYESFDNEDFMDYLGETDCTKLSEKAKIKVAEIMILLGAYGEAFSFIRDNNCLRVNPKRLLRLCSRLIITKEYDEDEFLLQLCGFSFFAGRYDETLLTYLTDYFNGTSSQMLELWERASENDIETYELEERIIIQMMFAHTFSENTTEVFAEYYGKGPKERVVEAYLSYNSYIYFVKDMVVGEDIFAIIEGRLELEKDMPVVCRLALLKYYAEQNNTSQIQNEAAYRLINDLCRKDYIFAIYSKFADRFKLPFDIADKTIVEYRTDPSHRVIIHYVYEDKDRKKTYVSEDMKNVFEGIFVKQFVLFYGENIQYYITEESEEGENITESCNLVNQDINPNPSRGRYESLNDILACQEMHDSQTFMKLVHTYAVTEYVTDQLFRPL